MTLSISIENDIRPELGDYNSIVCFKALVVGVQDALGEKAGFIALTAAGRQRGRQLADSLGLTNCQYPLEEAAELIKKALGEKGTRLCLIDSVEKRGEVFRVACRETICSSGEEPGSDTKLSYTLGAIQGALEAMFGLRLRGKQTESVLRGSTQDVVEFIVLGS
ncbi:hypothetical protein PN498_15070 [Oscillatoria sp. CS-180]|uniref:hypothetical protein n=1 Tax=Oscillatoria sp. CS-180 TaxID=3021720 RepID=UPI00232D4F02|nr:hypothetical protein [Oscillatoria sp. CS-180]MDB9527320.1 hypothetical protein [Oscillatoria sp. CS-180]